MDVTFVNQDGQRWTVSALHGQTLRDIAVDNGIPGIVGSCGGGCACASCHVYVDPAWLHVVNARHDMEEMALDMAYDVTERSRLACQIRMRDELDGLIVHTPENQG